LEVERNKVDYVEAYTLARKVRHEAMLAGMQALKRSLVKAFNDFAAFVHHKGKQGVHAH
jgi:hypothetical protein